MLHKCSNTLLLFCVQVQVSRMKDKINTWIETNIAIIVIYFGSFQGFKGEIDEKTQHCEASKEDLEFCVNSVLVKEPFIKYCIKTKLWHI